MGSWWYEKNPPKLCGLICDIIFKLGRSHQLVYSCSGRAPWWTKV